VWSGESSRSCRGGEGRLEVFRRRCASGGDGVLVLPQVNRERGSKRMHKKNRRRKARYRRLLLTGSTTRTRNSGGSDRAPSSDSGLWAASLEQLVGAK
jgi:hypothetical protein